MTKKDINEILDILEKEYPEAKCALNHRSAFELIIAVSMSAQTTDISVNKVTPVLFEKYKDVYALAKADRSDVEKIIKTIGMYRNKSKNIVNMSKMIVEEYDGIVPNEYDELIKLPGVGRKTANVVLSVGFGKQRIAVDTHVFRVSNRIGMVNEKNVLKTELELMKKIPEERWSKTHHSLIFHGRNCCTARKPNCENCVIKDKCKKVGVK